MIQTPSDRESKKSSDTETEVRNGRKMKGGILRRSGRETGRKRDRKRERNKENEKRGKGV